MIAASSRVWTPREKMRWMPCIMWSVSTNLLVTGADGKPVWEETEATVTTNADKTVTVEYPDVPNAVFGVFFEEK